MEARDMVKGGISPLNSNNFGIWATYFVAGISRYKGAKDVLNIVIPEGEGEEAKNKRMSDFGDTNDLVYSMLMEACFKHPEAMLVAANYTGGWANELFVILKERFDRVDRQITQSLVQEFHNTILLPRESGAQFVDRVKTTVKQIGEQNIEEKPTENSIIAVIKSAIKIKFPELYQLIDLHDINLDEVYKKVSKSATSKKKIDNSSESVAASFVYDNQSLHDGRNSFIQWTSEDRAKFCVAGSNKHYYNVTNKRLKIDNETTFAKSAVRSLSNKSIKKKGTTRRSNFSAKPTCFICKSTEHLINECSDR